jgi:hypothetical protein
LRDHRNDAFRFVGCSILGNSRREIAFSVQERMTIRWITSDSAPGPAAAFTGGPQSWLSVPAIPVPSKPLISNLLKTLGNGSGRIGFCFWSDMDAGNLPAGAFFAVIGWLEGFFSGALNRD